MLNQKPEINEWTREDVDRWLELTGFGRTHEIQRAFESNLVDGCRLLTLTEEELKSSNFDITSLGRRKNIMRAINYIKAKVCRNMNNGASFLLKPSRDLDDQVNRSAGSIQVLNRSNLGMASMDRSAILSSAQNFFKSKVRDASTTKNRLHFVD